MLDANNIHIRLVGRCIKPDQSPHCINYSNLSDAVRDYEEIRKISSSEESGDLHIQLYCNDKVVSQRYLNSSEYDALIQQIGICKEHAA